MYSAGYGSQTIGPAGPPGVISAHSTVGLDVRDGNNNNNSNNKEDKGEKKMLRMAGGEVWEDPSLAEWPEDDYRIFVGDLGNEVGDELLAKSFSHYSSVAKVKVVRDKVTGKSKGFGFVSLLDPSEFLKALKEMQGVYIGNRPCKIKKSNWKQRDLDVRKEKAKGYVNQLVAVQHKGTGKKVHKRKARPSNANRDEMRHKGGRGPPVSRDGHGGISGGGGGGGGGGKFF